MLILGDFENDCCMINDDENPLKKICWMQTITKAIIYKPNWRSQDEMYNKWLW